jgi:hypothetical protein
MDQQHFNDAIDVDSAGGVLCKDQGVKRDVPRRMDFNLSASVRKAIWAVMRAGCVISDEMAQFASDCYC